MKTTRKGREEKSWSDPEKLLKLGKLHTQRMCVNVGVKDTFGLKGFRLVCQISQGHLPCWFSSMFH